METKVRRSWGCGCQLKVTQITQCVYGYSITHTLGETFQNWYFSKPVTLRLVCEHFFIEQDFFSLNVVFLVFLWF